MQVEHIRHAAAVMSLAACLFAASAFGAGSAYPRSADEAISGALANVKSRYRAKLDHYGLSESYFDETSGICDLMLLDVPTWTKYQIVYYRATDQIEWPRMMPKGVAKDLMQDRLLIQKYELVLGKGKKKTKDGVESIEKGKGRQGLPVARSRNRLQCTRNLNLRRKRKPISRAHSRTLAKQTRRTRRIARSSRWRRLQTSVRWRN